MDLRINYPAYVIFAYLFQLTTVSFSQTRSTEEDLRSRELQLQQEVLKYQELESKLLETAFERTIDPETYVLGPGDYLLIDIGIEEQGNFKVPVTPEGVIVIPTVGSIPVDGITLSSARQRIETAVLTKYRKTGVFTYLVGLRKIRVHVTGKVFNPGTFVATPIDRVSDMLYRAGGLQDDAFIEQTKIKHRDNSETIVDFSQFQLNGNLTQNPHIKSGDIIVVPSVDFSKASVRVEGLLEDPGYFPLRSSQESVYEFLNRHGLISNTQKLKDIVIVSENNEVTHLDMTTQAAHEYKLKDGLTITLPKQIREVYVIGAVLRPGTYRHVNNLKASDYVGQAGSTEDAAGMGSIRVHRRESDETERGRNAVVNAGDIIEVPIRRSTKISEYLQIASQFATLIIAYFAIQRN